MVHEITHPLVLAVGKIAAEEGTGLYLVGGFVRDMMLGRRARTNDIDFTVEGSGIDFARIVAARFRSHAVVFDRFGTAMVPVDGVQLEFVGTRKEVYSEGSRKPTVTQGTLDDDLRRRDFTVNAMALKLGSGAQSELVDMFDGLGDIERKVLRTPLDPHITFSEDPLRMMRGARFASQLDFRLERPAFIAMRELAERIRIISQERITDELLKTLASPKPSIGLSILFETGLLKLVFPEVDRLEGVDLMKTEGVTYAHKNVFWHTLKVVDNIALATDNIWLRFAALMHDVAKPATKKFREGSGWSFHGHDEIGARWQERIFRRLRLPLRETEYVASLVRLHHRPMVLVDEGVTDSAIRRLVVDAGDRLDDLFTLCRADITSRDSKRVQRYLENYERVIERIREVEEKDRLRSFQSPVRGEEIMEICGIPPSRAVGLLKTAIEEAILDGRIPNEYEAAKEYLLQIRNDVLTG